MKIAATKTDRGSADWLSASREYASAPRHLRSLASHCRKVCVENLRMRLELALAEENQMVTPPLPVAFTGRAVFATTIFPAATPRA